MKNTIKEFIEPTNKEKQELWQKAVFDTNVLLNLYRYSAKTRKSLLAAFENFKDRVWIHTKWHMSICVNVVRSYMKQFKDMNNLRRKCKTSQIMQ